MSLKNSKLTKIDDVHLEETGDVAVRKVYNWGGVCALESKLQEELAHVQEIKAKMVELGIGQ